MIIVGNNKVTAINLGEIPGIAVYLGSELVWPDATVNEILSCFASGYWIDEYPWTDDYGWAD